MEVLKDKSANNTAGFNMPRETARFNMIEQQVRTWEVLDPTVLQLLNDVPRERFVPQDYQGLAFADLEIPIGHDQKMLSPKLEGRIVQSVSVDKTDKVLQIGTGSGYLTALLAKLAQHVFSVEIAPALSQFAAQQLHTQGIQNITLIEGDAAHGWPAEAPYDVIVFCGSAQVEPKDVRQQLAIGGRMFVVVGQAPVMRAMLIQRISEQGFKEDVLFETCVDELIHADQASAFQF